MLMCRDHVQKVRSCLAAMIQRSRFGSLQRAPRSLPSKMVRVATPVLYQPGVLDGTQIGYSTPSRGQGAKHSIRVLARSPPSLSISRSLSPTWNAHRSFSLLYSGVSERLTHRVSKREWRVWCVHVERPHGSGVLVVNAAAFGCRAACVWLGPRHHTVGHKRMEEAGDKLFLERTAFRPVPCAQPLVGGRERGTGGLLRLLPIILFFCRM